MLSTILLSASLRTEPQSHALAPNPVPCTQPTTHNSDPRVPAQRLHELHKRQHVAVVVRQNVAVLAAFVYLRIATVRCTPARWRKQQRLTIHTGTHHNHVRPLEYEGCVAVQEHWSGEQAGIVQHVHPLRVGHEAPDIGGLCKPPGVPGGDHRTHT